MPQLDDISPHVLINRSRAGLSSGFPIILQNWEKKWSCGESMVLIPCRPNACGEQLTHNALLLALSSRGCENSY